MHRTGSFNLVNRTFEQDQKKYPKLRGSVGSDLHGLEQDRAIKTEPGEAKRRRTIKLHRNRGQSWGFTLQTYGIRNKRTREVEIMSYVDYVEIDGSAWLAGMRRGDIILSVNGESVELCTHRELVKRIQSCSWELRLVVLFEDCCQKVELHERYLKLKRLLSQKVKELRGLEAEEKKISQGIPLSRCDSFRQSTYSSTSSDWDIYSEITSPTLLDSVPVNRFAFRDSYSPSVSDISTESSVNSGDSLTSFSSFMPRAEEDCSSLRSVYDTEDVNRTSGSRFEVTKGNNLLRSAVAEDSSFPSSNILRTQNGNIPKFQLVEHEASFKVTEDDRLSSFIQDSSNSRSPCVELEDESRFIEDDRLSSFIQDSNSSNSRFSHVDLDSNSRFSRVESDSNKHFSLHSSFEQESGGFLQEELEGRQRCMMCGFEHKDNSEELNEVACRHTFHESPDADSVIESCDALPEMPQCLLACIAPNRLTPANAQIIGTLCRHEVSSLASAAGLKAENIWQRLAALPDASDTAETQNSFGHQDLVALEETVAARYAQFGPGNESFTDLTDNCTAQCLAVNSSYSSITPTPASMSSTSVCMGLDHSLDAAFCDACQHDSASCVCSNYKCPDISNSSINCHDISNGSTKCEDITIGNIKCLDINNSKTKHQESSECQDSMTSIIFPDISSSDRCSKYPDNICTDSDKTCLNSALSFEKCSEQNRQSLQTGGGHSSIATSSKWESPDLFSQSSAAPVTGQSLAPHQATVSSKKRLINGVLVNDRSYSTRL
ncbi:hypothetical protein BsWGS_25026 [Bradybaena similaris]